MAPMLRLLEVTGGSQGEVFAITLEQALSRSRDITAIRPLAFIAR